MTRARLLRLLAFVALYPLAIALCGLGAFWAGSGSRSLIPDGASRGTANAITYVFVAVGGALGGLPAVALGFRATRTRWIAAGPVGATVAVLLLLVVYFMVPPLWWLLPNFRPLDLLLTLMFTFFWASGAVWLWGIWCLIRLPRPAGTPT